MNEKQYNKVLDYVNQYGATHHEKRKQHKIYQEPQQQKYDHYFANDEVVLTQSKGRGR
ncbi:hypothetical protein HpBHB18_09030 [Helicobacter pylori]